MHAKCNPNELKSTSWYAFGDEGLKIAPMLPLITGNISLDIICSYLESFKTYKALKLTILEK